MKTTFTQAATFALSAAGALAILVGTIDQSVAAQMAGSPTGALVAAAASPAVSPLA
ncbi:MAG: hypothetical protein U0S50_02445 [Sphingopyxis sp.]|uniref:hypothetical protein n=1 Tax=Sphingopyxis sp. TaxID=1908224 RepID=UPI002AB82326|nr:hypothetical protein [Sphingopyxis sp.]MDZ3830661.1 hypothetical protein [Sphingopyxis sp.]